MFLIFLGPLTLSSTYADQESVEDSNKFMEEVIPLLEKKEELEALPKDVQDFLKLMESFSVAEQGVAKVVKSRIYSLTWHPSNSKLLVAAGDRGGSIGKHLICISVLRLIVIMSIFRFLGCRCSGRQAQWRASI
jgi:hypothetical protein